MQDFSVISQGKSPGAGMVGHLRSESQMRYLKKHLQKHTVKKLFGSGDFKLCKAKQAEDISKYFLSFHLIYVHCQLDLLAFVRV